jgi:hypothetical protein
MGSTPVPGVGESVSLSRTLSKDSFGETPKPTPEMGVLSSGLQIRFLRSR